MTSRGGGFNFKRGGTTGGGLGGRSGGGFNFNRSSSGGSSNSGGRSGFGFNRSGSGGSSGSNSRSGGGGFNFNKGGSNSNSRTGSGSGFGFNRGGSNSRTGGFNRSGSGSGSGFSFNRGGSGSNSRTGSGSGFGFNRSGSNSGMSFNRSGGREAPPNPMYAQTQSIFDSYLETDEQEFPSSACSFKYVLYDLEPDPTKLHTYPCPPFMENNRRQWQSAVERNPNPDKLVPCAVVGFTALKERLETSMKRVADSALNSGRLGESIERLREGSSSLESRLEDLRRRQLGLSHRLLELMGLVERLRLRGQPLTRKEAELREYLEAFEGSLGDPQRRTQEVLLLGRNRQRNEKNRLAPFSLTEQREAREEGKASSSLTDRQRRDLFEVLDERTEGLEHLVGIVKKMSRDLDIMKRKRKREIESQRKEYEEHQARLGFYQY